MSYILVKDSQTGVWQRVREEELRNEEELQELVKMNPDTLPIEDLGETVPPLLVVGRESNLPNGAPDLICIDEDGLITVIECKLSRNPEVKRKVIGQILGYGAFLWQMSYDEFEAQIALPYFNEEKRCHDPELRGKSLTKAMAWFRQRQGRSPEDWSEQDFGDAVGRYLQDGRLRLLIVVDKVNDELRRTVEFLNNCTAPHFQVVCAELPYFKSDPYEMLIPQLIGVPSVTKVALPRGRWDKSKYFAKAPEQAGPEATNVLRELYDWAKAAKYEISWGTGVQTGSFTPKIRRGTDLVSLLNAYTSGSVSICFGQSSLVGDAPLRDELRQRLNELPNINWDETILAGVPSFRVTDVLGNETALQQFKDTMERFVEQLRAGVSGPSRA